MITTVLRINSLYLLRDRVALILTFLLPLVFLSVFDAVFAPLDTATARAVNTIIVVDQETSFAGRLAERLAENPGLDVVRRGSDSRETALESVRRGQAAVALILPAGLRPALPGVPAWSGLRVTLAVLSGPLVLSSAIAPSLNARGPTPPRPQNASRMTL